MKRPNNVATQPVANRVIEYDMDCLRHSYAVDIGGTSWRNGELKLDKRWCFMAMEGGYECICVCIVEGGGKIAPVDIEGYIVRYFPKKYWSIRVGDWERGRLVGIEQSGGHFV